MYEHSLIKARCLGYTGMQYNAVVSANTAAIKLWKKLGFEIAGTIPNGFLHMKLGYIDTYIMYRDI